MFPEQGLNMGFNQIEHWIGNGIYLLIFGGSFTAIGVFSSSVTKNQMVAGMLTFTLLTIYLSIMSFSFGNGNSYPDRSNFDDFIDGSLGSLSDGLDKLQYFSVGLIDIGTILNQLALIAFFLILSTVQVERLNN